MPLNKMKAPEVYRLVKQVPRGRVTTYGALAKALKEPGAGRAVGQILKRNPHPVVVPCHRVVRSDGSLGGYGGNSPPGIKKKIELLKAEGIMVLADKGNFRVRPFRRFFFDDFKEVCVK